MGNEAAGYAALIARLRPLRGKRIVLEAAGGYERAPTRDRHNRRASRTTVPVLMPNAFAA